jgi:hypothetical protein
MRARTKMAAASLALGSAAAGCWLRGERRAVAVLLAGIPAAVLFFFFERMMRKTLEHMGSSGSDLRRTLTLGELWFCTRGFFTWNGMMEMLWATRLRTGGAIHAVGGAAPDVAVHPLEASGEAAPVRLIALAAGMPLVLSFGSCT